MDAPTQRTVALLVEYDGTRYAGFQLQARGPTVQGELESAIARLTLTPTRVRGAGRTDSGVHAKGQVVAFSTASTLPCTAMVSGLNHFLPVDIAVQAAHDVRSGFDPRRHAKSRTYRYTILKRATRSPFWERYAYRVTEPLDEESMRRTLKLFEGVHDFAAFSGPVASGRSTVRQVYATRLWCQNNLIRFEMEATAFLPHQVRRIVGVLVAAGTGRISPKEVSDALEGGGDRARLSVAPTVPPQGLCLMQVKYEDFPPNGHKTNENL